MNPLHPGRTPGLLLLFSSHAPLLSELSVTNSDESETGQMDRETDRQTDRLTMIYFCQLQQLNFVLLHCAACSLDADIVAPSSVSGVQSLGSSVGENVDKHRICQNWWRFKNLSHTFACWECDLFLILLCFCFRVWGMGPGSLWESFL